jgi:hypothetical protein
VELIDKITVQMGSDITSVGTGIVACVFGFGLEFTRMKIDNNMIKILEKIGRGVIPKDYLSINFNNEEFRELRLRILIETFTKAFLRMNKEVPVEELNLLDIMEKRSLVKILQRLERLVKKGISFKDDAENLILFEQCLKQ